MSRRRMRMPIPSGGGSDEELILVVLMMFCCISIVILGLGMAFFGQGEEGDPCKVSDETTEYVLDDKLKCQFLRCKDGYALDSEGVCVVDQSGQTCTGTDPNAIYKTDVSNVCTFSFCQGGYELGDAGTCVVAEEGELPRAGVYVGEGAPATQNCVAVQDAWGACSASCGGGTQTRGWTITSDETNGGTCPERGQTESQPCNTDACYATFDPVHNTEYVNNDKTTRVLETMEWVDCDYTYNDKGGLKRFQLERRGSGQTDRVRYDYTCLDEKTNPSLTYTDNKSPLAAHSGNAYGLSYFPVDCGDYPISAFHFDHTGWYDFKCISNTPHTGDCRDLNTQWDTRSREIVYLDRHNVNCDGNNEVITKFALEDDKTNGKFRYNYRCCTMPSPK
jgi:hypothetical protein